MRILGILFLILIGFGAVATPRTAHAQSSVSLNFDFFGAPAPAPPPAIAIAPPPLPVYVVPTPPTDGYIWEPGHWSWNGYSYYWVPGVWVAPPRAGLLWTPGYWAWASSGFIWHAGYWGPHVGFYGGIHYGGGYDGVGFNGGRWDGGHYIVDRSVVNVTNIVHATSTTNRASFNGGPGGTHAGPTAEQKTFTTEQHTAATNVQIDHARAAADRRDFEHTSNRGKPAVAAASAPKDFEHNVVPAQHAGPRNAEADRYNRSVRSNPSIAHGAMMPRQHEAAPQQAQPHQGGNGGGEQQGGEHH